MKVYNVPPEVPTPKMVFGREGTYEKLIEQHKQDLKQWLISKGYIGKHTGACIQYPVADGYAEYMLADGKKSFLIHLPYYDGYRCVLAERSTKTQILSDIKHREKMAKLFG